jgi:hypothetical protein
MLSIGSLELLKSPKLTGMLKSPLERSEALSESSGWCESRYKGSGDSMCSEWTCWIGCGAAGGCCGAAGQGGVIGLTEGAGAGSGAAGAGSTSA